MSRLSFLAELAMELAEWLDEQHVEAILTDSRHESSNVTDIRAVRDDNLLLCRMRRIVTIEHEFQCGVEGEDVWVVDANIVGV